MHDGGSPLLGLVLVGGFSRRMGRDKWSLPYGGRAQVERAVELLAPIVREVHLSCRPEQTEALEPLGVPLIVDRVEGQGPLGGIDAALRARAGVAWLVLACDLPLLDRETLEGLIAARAPSRPVTACAGPAGEPEPLCAIYEAAIAPAVAGALQRGENSPLRLIRSLGPALVRVDRPEALTNVNDPAAYARVEAPARRAPG